MKKHLTECERREHQRSATVSQFGRSYCRITCPFCLQVCTAYIWSLAGGGKRCPGCKALHTSIGFTFRDVEPEEGNGQKETA